MQLFYSPNPEMLPEEEARHCVKILRHQPGDPLCVTDGKGFFYDVVLINAKGKLEPTAPPRQAPKSNYTLHLAVAPTKSGERTDWMIEKAVEFGIQTITFLECDRSERTRVNLERCERVAIAAMKQSLKAWLPVLRPLTPSTDILANAQEATRLIAHCENTFIRILPHEVKSTQEVICCIGPEGDFSSEEILIAEKNGFQGFSLGPSRLRTETAAIAACSYFYFRGLSM